MSSFASVMPSDLGLLCLGLHSALAASQQRACLGRCRRASATLVSARLFEAREGRMLVACFAELQRNTICFLSDRGPRTQTRHMSPWQSWQFARVSCCKSNRLACRCYRGSALV